MWPARNVAVPSNTRVDHGLRQTRATLPFASVPSRMLSTPIPSAPNPRWSRGDPKSMDHLLENLNQAQREAVLHVDGPLLILAGPGSGKTRVVTHRIAHLLEQGVSARQILALTFTNKAASEMRSRAQVLAPGQPVWVSTFHRFGARMLREFGELVGLAPNFTIYDTSDSRQVLKRVIEAEKVHTMHYSPDRIAGAITRGKEQTDYA